MPIKWTDADVLAEGRKYSTRAEFHNLAYKAYRVAYKRNLLDLLYPVSRRDWSKDEDVLAEGRKYATGAAFEYATRGAYNGARQRRLLDLLYPSKMRDWSNDEDVLAEGRKYGSRFAFQCGSKGAYNAAQRRNLLDLLDWPDAGASSNNDTIYIWRAVGQHYNGHPVYKIGVTSARLGVRRIEEVARDSGFEFDLICCEPVACKATELERKLHLLGEDPQFTGFNGATEFRALSDSALYAAISMICNVTK